MGSTDKARNKGEEIKGKIKETTGKAVGNDEMEAEGETDQKKGNMKQAGEKIKDVFKD
ncbi:MAG TPA: CsbD family protein [Actinoallomurus sp.]|nr:CsbD family protein [Actinoallomurus sp.]